LPITTMSFAWQIKTSLPRQGVRRSALNFNMGRTAVKRSSLHTLLAGLACAALGVGGAAAGPNLVLNGGFEMSSNTQSTLLSSGTTSVTDWTSNGIFVLYCTAAAGTTCDEGSILGAFALQGPANGNNNGLASSPQGGAYMAFDSDPGFHGTFTQTITGLSVGQKYALSFYMAGTQDVSRDSATTESITATLGAESYTTSTINTPAAGFSPWQHYSTTFTYTGGGNILSFLATGGPSGQPPYALLDGVSLTAVTGGVPEPTTWAMIVAGFVGLSFAARARRKLAAVPA
jgi:hypothetical protein